MSDIKLFQLGADGIGELAPQAAQVERSLQQLFERNLEALLGVRFLASEYGTGPVHGGRIDTLGIDEDGSPVIIEYKRALNENVINQGLFYLDWLMDHQKDFQWLVLDRLGQATAEKVEWSSPRLICIAGDFTRYDGHAVNQIHRNIELIRYRRFAQDLLMIELVHAPRGGSRVPSGVSPQANAAEVSIKDPYQSQRIDYRLGQAPAALRDVWEAALSFLNALGDDVQVKELKLYWAIKRLKNFACLEIYPTGGTVLAFLRIDPDSIVLEPGFTRDMRKIGHFGTGDLEVRLKSIEDVTKAQTLFQRAYDQS